GCQGGFGYADNAHTRDEGCEFRAADNAPAEANSQPPDKAGPIAGDSA
ncbi:MAG: hypothetical protein JWM02_3652, partial [Frankiales bacterium]|nr:hypothetical protein [Frankiales bacterium]